LLSSLSLSGGLFGPRLVVRGLEEPTSGEQLEKEPHVERISEQEGDALFVGIDVPRKID
jgi:hypothetical protein